MKSQTISSIFWILIIFCPTVWAQEFLRDFGAPGQQKKRLFLKQSMDGVLSPTNEREDDQAARQLEAFLYLPVYQDERNTYALTGKTNHLHFNELHPSRDFVPAQDLYNHQFGFAWAHREENKNSWGAGVNYGSASDKPFESENVRSLDVVMIRKIEETATSSWIYLLSYSNNRSFLSGIPLPGFAYVFMDEAKTQGGVLGIPFVSYWWRPTAKTSYSVFYLFPTMLNMQAGYMLGGPFQANLKFEYGQQTFMRSHRQHRDDRMYYDTKKIVAQLKALLGPVTFFELEVARVFDRALYDGKSTLELTSDRLRLAGEWQASAAMQISF